MRATRRSWSASVGFPGLFFAAIFLLLGPLTLFVDAQVFEYPTVYSRVTQPIDESQLTVLKGHVHPLARAEFDRGLVDDQMPVEHLIVLLQRSPEQQQSAALLSDRLQDRKSSMYHRWLTAEEFGRHFGPTDEDLGKLTGWLQSKGFTIEDVPPGRTHVVISGTAGMVRDALHTAIHNLSVDGKQEKAVLSDPQVPSALAPIIAGFYRLYSWQSRPLHRMVDRISANVTSAGENRSGQVPDFTFGYEGETFTDVAPYDWYKIYQVGLIFAAGISGAGQTIAVLEETEVVNQSDVTTFRSQFGLPAYPATPNRTQGGVNWLYGPGNGCLAPPQPTSTDEETEALLDTQWAGVAAPYATVDFVACESTGSGIGSQGVDIAASYVANYLYSTVVAASLSYGLCEMDASATGTAYYANVWQQMAAAGITVAVSAGDSGSMGCDQPASQSLETYATHNLSSNALASSAYNISAGGTDFSDVYQAGSNVDEYWSAQNGQAFSSALSYIPEMAWGGECSSPMFASYFQNTGNTSFGTSYTPEAICNNLNARLDGLLQVVGGGGGISSYTTLPTWQSAYGVGLNGNGSSGSWRNQPDISLFASNGLWNHALTFCQSDTGHPCTYSQSGDAVYLQAGGTSFVAPQIAGLMALINQYTNSRQGVANYTLYSLAAIEYGVPGNPNSTSLANCSGSMLGSGVGQGCIFRDIAATPNPAGGTILSDTVQPCKYSSYVSLSPSNCYRSDASDAFGLSSLSGTTWADAYPVSNGYDLATGLGSVSAYYLLANWDTEISFPSATTLSANPTTVSAGGNTTLTATVSTTGRGGVAPAVGTVTFYSGGLSGTPVGTSTLAQACSGTPPDKSCPPATATLIVTSKQLNPGANVIVAEFSGDAANDAPSSSAPVIVTEAASSANVITLDATNVTSSSASLSGSVNPAGSTGYAYFRWGTSSASLTNYTGHQAVTANFNTQNFTAAIGNLTSGTKYYYEMVFDDSSNNSYQSGFVLNFGALAPALVTQAATAITSSGASLNGSVNPEGSTGYAFFLWGTTPALSLSANSQTGYQTVAANFSAQSFTAGIGDLTSGTIYYYQMGFYDTANGIYQYGSVVRFAALPLALVTQAATAITSSSASLNGSVNPEGSSGYAFFLWGTTPTLSLSSNTGYQAVAVNFTAQGFRATISDLTSGITYYYQVGFYAAANNSYQYGTVLSFATP